MRLDLPFRIEPRPAPSGAWGWGAPVLALALTVVLTAGVFGLLGRNPVAALGSFFLAPLAGPEGLTELLIKATPLVLIALGLVVAYRANVWNIGAEGQFVLGAICGGGVGLVGADWPAALVFPLMMLAAIAGGAAWAGLPALLRTRWNASEILTSLMLTYVARLLLIYLVSGPWRDPEGLGFPQTALFSPAATVPLLVSGSRLHLGMAIAPLVAIAVWFGLGRSLLGFQLRVAGLAPRAARFAGYSINGLIWVALLISGGLAGLAGMIEVAGPIGQITAEISTGYGFTAIIVAFLGRLNPLGVVLAGLVLAVSYLGGEEVQMDLGLPHAVTGIFQGVLLFCLLGADLLITHRLRWQRPLASGARA